MHINMTYMTSLVSVLGALQTHYSKQSCILLRTDLSDNQKEGVGNTIIKRSPAIKESCVAVLPIQETYFVRLSYPYKGTPQTLKSNVMDLK